MNKMIIVLLLLISFLGTSSNNVVSATFPTGHISCLNPTSYGACSLRTTTDDVSWIFFEVTWAENLMVKMPTTFRVYDSQGLPQDEASFYLQFSTLRTPNHPQGYVFAVKELTNFDVTGRYIHFLTVTRDNIPAGIEGGFVLTMSLDHPTDPTAPVFNNQITELNQRTWELDLGEQYRPGTLLPESSTQNPPLIYSHFNNSKLEYYFYGTPGIYRGELANAQDTEDTYLIEVGFHHLVTVQLRRGSFGPNGLILEVFNQQGELLPLTEEYSRPTIHLYNPEVTTQTWRIKISHPNPNDEYIDYRLSVFSQNQNDAGLGDDAGDEQALHLTIPSPGPYLGTLGWGDEIDWYSVVLNETTDLVIQLTGINDDHYYISQLCPPTGCYEIAPGTNGVTHVNAAPGVWYFQIITVNHDGLYWLDLSY